MEQNLNHEILDAFDRFIENPKNKIFKIVYGRSGFDLARRMLNWSEQIWDDEWTSKWTNYEKDHSLFIIYKRKLRVHYQIGIKLWIGSGNNFAGVGEIHPEKKALRIWEQYLTE